MNIPAACQLMPFATSAYLFLHTCAMRNPTEQKREVGQPERRGAPAGELKPAEDGCALTFAKRFTAEFCFAGLAVLGLVEAVVRAIFAIPAFFITLCTGTENKTFGGYLWAATWKGARLSLAISLESSAALVVNLYQKKIDDERNSALPNSVINCIAG